MKHGAVPQFDHCVEMWFCFYSLALPSLVNLGKYIKKNKIARVGKLEPLKACCHIARVCPNGSH